MPGDRFDWDSVKFDGTKTAVQLAGILGCSTNAIRVRCRKVGGKIRPTYKRGGQDPEEVEEMLEMKPGHNPVKVSPLRPLEGLSGYVRKKEE